MEHKLLLCVLMLLVQVCLAKVHRLTVVKGQTVHFKCPNSGGKRTSMDWKNPHGETLFFKDTSGKFLKGLKSQRFNIVKSSASEFTFSISHVTLKDGGNYLCNQYDDKPKQTIVHLAVLGPPKIETSEKGGSLFISCTAEASHGHSQIMWKVDLLSEIPAAQTHFTKRNRKYVSRAWLCLPAKRKQFTVSCLVRHPDLKEHLLMNLITLRQNSKQVLYTSSAATTQVTTDRPQTTTSSVTGSTLDLPTASSDTHNTDYGSTTSEKTTASEAFTSHNDTTGERPFDQTTEETKPYNDTGHLNDPNMHRGSSKNSSALLIFLVTCLILCLMVVVIFIGIKMRKAHITWKKENEESNPSTESSKSKPSQEENSSQGQRPRGILNSAFAPYAVEQQMATSVINTAVMTAPKSPIQEPSSLPQTTKSSECYPKETEL